VNDFRLDDGRLMSKRTWGGGIPPAPSGAQMHVMVMATSVGQHHEGILAMVLPEMDGPIHLTIECLVHNFSPPSPPETDLQRRHRLVAQVLERAREAGTLGLTTDDQTTTVDAILSALDGEFVDEDMTDLNPNDDDPCGDQDHN
jgi:hypothetical protein